VAGGGGTFDLPAGSGEVKIHDNVTAVLGMFLVYGGNIEKVAGGAAMVVGVAGADEIGLAWTGSAYQISNGYAADHALYIALTKTRTSV
jgi:hypothetical protein